MISAFPASAVMAANSRGSVSVSADNRIFGASFRMATSVRKSKDAE